MTLSFHMFNCSPFCFSMIICVIFPLTSHTAACCYCCCVYLMSKYVFGIIGGLDGKTRVYIVNKLTDKRIIEIFRA